jgi:hypothetical protein
MPNQPASPNDMNKALFLNLLSMLSMSAMQELGKLKNPFTGKTEVHLDMAQATIDMLDMLEAKTRGNRDKDEERIMNDTLTMLKMNYVETQGAEPRKTEIRDQKSEPQNSEPQKTEATPTAGKVSEQEAKETGNPGETETAGPATSKQTAEVKTEPKDPKFHKSYT